MSSDRFAPVRCGAWSLLSVLLSSFSGTLSAEVPAAPVSRLPLIERPSAQPTSEALAIFLTGDGGWAPLDRGITKALNENGVSVVGLNSRQYLETRRTPDDVARDVQAITAHYGRAWGKSAIVLIGFSRGAELLPFAVSRFPAELRNQVRLVAFLGLGRIADFEFRLMDLIRFEPRETSLPVAPELEKLRGLNLLFVRGDADDDAMGAELEPRLGKVIITHGDHHLGRDYMLLGQHILEAYPASPQSSR